MQPVQYLALDFDGVIADSLMECLVTAHNAFARHLGLDDFRIDLQGFSKEDIQKFRETRSYIRRGEDYVYLLYAANQRVPLTKQSDFDDFAEQHETLREVFRSLFYGQRKLLQEKHRDAWIALNGVYPGMDTFLKGLEDTDKAFIVTTKDLDSVDLILKSLDIHLNRGQMFQASKTYRKPEILNHILKKFDIDAHDIHFIDDHAGTVIEVSENTDVECYFAQWGYHSQEQMELMIENRGETLSLRGFLDRYHYLTTQ